MASGLISMFQKKVKRKNGNLAYRSRSQTILGFVRMLF